MAGEGVFCCYSGLGGLLALDSVVLWGFERSLRGDVRWRGGLGGGGWIVGAMIGLCLRSAFCYFRSRSLEAIKLWYATRSGGRKTL